MPISYSFNPTRAIGVAGQIADLRDYEGITRRNVEASLAIPFGVALIQMPTIPGGVVLPRDVTTGSIPAIGAAAFAGVSVRSNTETGTYVVNDVFSVMRRGVMYVVSETAVTNAMMLQNGVVRVRLLASGGNTQLGAFRSTADTDVDSVALLNNARFLSTCAAGGIVMVEIPASVTFTIGS